IDNPVIHDGLETNTIFIKKTENAIINLVKLYQANKLKTTRLIQWYQWLKDYGLLSSFEWAYTKMENKIQTNILSEKPSVKLFNFWKLHLFIKYLKSNAS
nr:hypothetical protein [Saprospiraceae bacterium]